MSSSVMNSTDSNPAAAASAAQAALEALFTAAEQEQQVKYVTSNVHTHS